MMSKCPPEPTGIQQETPNNRARATSPRQQVGNHGNTTPPSPPSIIVSHEEDEQILPHERLSQYCQTPKKVLPDPHRQLLSPRHHGRDTEAMFGEKSDWMLAEGRLVQRSPLPLSPRSPSGRQSAPCYEGPRYPVSREEGYPYPTHGDTERVRKRLFHRQELPDDSLWPSGIENVSPGLNNFRSDPWGNRDSPSSPAPRIIFPMDPPVSRLLSKREQFASKRRLVLDGEEDMETMVKRHKADLDRERGLKYINELRTDVTRLRDQLRKPDTETNKPSDCACAVMERQFMELAESAYRSIRRMDCTPKGFEQFKRELIQTNEVIKDSLDVLKAIKRCCEHTL